MATQDGTRKAEHRVVQSEGIRGSLAFQEEEDPTRRRRPCIYEYIASVSRERVRAIWMDEVHSSMD